MSEVTIRDIKGTVDMMCPVKIIIDGNIVWDDDVNSNAEYDTVFESNTIVKELSFEITHFHHSVVTIITV